MNVIDHPFGGGAHQHAGRPKTVSRGTSPGARLGLDRSTPDRQAEEVRKDAW